MKGLLLTITGDGKGKTTSALGTVVRALGRGWRVTILQFVKNEGKTGEKLFFERFPELVTMEQLGEGFSWQDKDHAAAAEAGWQKALPGSTVKNPAICSFWMNSISLSITAGLIRKKFWKH